MKRNLNLKVIVQNLISIGEYRLAFKLILNEYRVVRLLHARKRFLRKCTKVQRHLTEANNQAALAVFKVQLNDDIIDYTKS